MKKAAWFASCMVAFTKLMNDQHVELENMDLVDQCQYVYAKLPWQRLGNYTPNKAIGITVDSIYKNVGMTCNKIYEHVDILQRTGTPNAAMCQYEIHTVRFNKFLLTDDGRYLSLTAGMGSLRDAVNKLCDTIRVQNHKDQNNHSYNMRLMTPLLRHLIDIAAVANEIVTRD